MVVYRVCRDSQRDIDQQQVDNKDKKRIFKARVFGKNNNSTLSLVQVHICWLTLKPRSNCSAQSCSFTPAQYQVSSRALHEGPLAKREKEAAFISPVVAAAALGQKKTHTYPSIDAAPCNTIPQ